MSGSVEAPRRAGQLIHLPDTLQTSSQPRSAEQASGFSHLLTGAAFPT